VRVVTRRPLGKFNVDACFSTTRQHRPAQAVNVPPASIMLYAGPHPRPQSNGTARPSAAGKRGTGAEIRILGLDQTRSKPGLAPESPRSTSRRRPSPTEGGMPARRREWLVRNAATYKSLPPATERSTERLMDAALLTCTVGTRSTTDTINRPPRRSQKE
jgi:hypothetical protein